MISGLMIAAVIIPVANDNLFVLRQIASRHFAIGSWQRQMAERLYGVEGTEPLIFAVIASLLSVAALVACWLPARKAAQIDPLAALRHE